MNREKTMKGAEGRKRGERGGSEGEGRSGRGVITFNSGGSH